MFNLVGNSLKFTEKGNITVSLQALPSRDDGYRKVKIIVSDTGKGMSEGTPCNGENVLDDIADC